ncbi:M1 family aminopeptidase [Longimicrobium sp.]|uniref:M1 family metallopeptidase n=1 Tax=Longimicrobium sp. TaxID=2029185 RepID=UPI002E3429A1|nr:M1 family aminopeptidase [Longimicrobium sp.]HEX6041396.1 M1 family aminopeptidase [Longimicrobium sp.]
MTIDSRALLLSAVLVCAALARVPAVSAQAPRVPAADELMQPGVSLELARHRAATLRDVRYLLALDVTEADTARGNVTATFHRATGAGDLVMDFRGPSLSFVTVNGAAVEDAEWRNGHLRIPARHLRDGENQVAASFTARIAAAGSSIIRFSDATDGGTYLYTLLVPADANQLFPSFDQPDLKARFRYHITAPSAWQVLANGPGRREEHGGETMWIFDETEPISTYLAAFAAGPWRTWSSDEGGRPITLYARASRADEVDADTLITVNRRAIQWLERYFGVNFPFTKYDMLLAPAFPFGGMEHVGAVFYNENTFIFREAPTLGQQISRKSTIYHEVAHQWFGDLVTMVWFDDLWLKEGFSTYMAARMQDELDPGSEAWKTFYLRNKPLAYATDQTGGTTPVWQSLPNLDLAKSNYGPIVYNKAPAILKQLEAIVGDSAFRAGLTLFLRRHAYANATWRDLLAALEESSGVDLTAFGEQYILRAGMPVVETDLRVRDGRIERLTLRQRPARPMPDDPGGYWPIHVQVRLSYGDREDVVLPVSGAAEVMEVAAARGLPAPDYVWSNEGDYGYGLFLLDARSREYVAGHVGQETDGLRRAMLWGALWDEVREGRMDPARYARIALRELPRERDEQIASLNMGRAWTALASYLPEERARPLLADWERLLLARADDAALTYGARKAALDMLVGTARTDAGQALLREYLAGTRTFNGEAVKQPTRWSIVEQLVALGAADPQALIAAESARDSTPDAGRRAYIAGAAVPAADVKAAYFGRFLDDPGLNEDWVTAALGNFNAPRHAALTLRYLRPSLDRLEWVRDNRRIFFLPRWISAFVGGHTGPEALAMVDRFLAENPELPADIRRKVLQSRDELERTVRIRAAAAQGER